MASTGAPTHVTETLQDRIKSREMATARQSGAVAPEVDVKTGSMINPHNPEFITARPWYLGGGEGPSLDHQADQRTESETLELSLQAADQLVKQQRASLKQQQRYKVGMWVESLKKNRKPWRICQIVKIQKKGTVFDLKYDDDGYIERNVKGNKNRIRMTKSGSRSFAIDNQKYGKETFDSKRDKYHGFEVNQHLNKIQEKFQNRDSLRKKIRVQQNQKDNTKNKTTNKENVNSDSDSDSDSDYDSDDGSDSDDEFVQRDEDAKVHVSRLARQGGVGGQQMKVTARNLRIREDTAKYLWNLDPNSAYYDPKSRSMRDNPNPAMDVSESQFTGDNFARISGDAIGLAQTQLFAWDVAEKVSGDHDTAVAATGGGGDVAPATSTMSVIHPQANPSQAELLKKKYTTQSLDLSTKRKKAVLDKYGGAEHLDGSGGLGSVVGSSTNNKSLEEDNSKEVAANERKVRFGVNVVEERYTRDGELANSNGTSSNNNNRSACVNQKSKYDEDIFINGHTTVWGSYFQKGAFQWGYADDHSLMRNSYCTGINGRIANDEANAIKYGTGKAGSAELAKAREMLKYIPKTGNTTNKKNNELPSHTMSKLYGEADQLQELNQEKLQIALAKHDEKQQDELSIDDRKRKYNSKDNTSIDVTEEDMEAYRLKKARADDPMSKINGDDEILDYVKK